MSEQQQEVRVRIAMHFDSEAAMAGFVERAVASAIQGRQEPPLDGTPCAVVFRDGQGRWLVFQDGKGAAPAKMGWDSIQTEVAEWAAVNFGMVTTWQTALGVCEEAGEIARVVLKHSQGIRGFDDERRKGEIAKEAGDVVIWLMHLCELLGISLRDAVDARWSEVKQRDWTK